MLQRLITKGYSNLWCWGNIFSGGKDEYR